MLTFARPFEETRQTFEDRRGNPRSSERRAIGYQIAYAGRNPRTDEEKLLIWIPPDHNEHRPRSPVQSKVSESALEVR